jgi:hypothetical protein
VCVAPPGSEQAARLEPDGGPDVLLAHVVPHHHRQALRPGLLVEHRLAAVAVAGDGERVGDVVTDELAPHGGQAGEVLVRRAALLQDAGGDEQGVGEGAGGPRGPGRAHTWGRRSGPGLQCSAVQCSAVQCSAV